MVDGRFAAVLAAPEADTGEAQARLAATAASAAASIRAVYVLLSASMPAATLSRRVAPTGKEDGGLVAAACTTATHALVKRVTVVCGVASFMGGRHWWGGCPHRARH